MRIAMPWNNLEDVINAQKKPNRDEAIQAIKNYWLLPHNISEREINYTQAEDPTMIHWMYCDHQENDWARLERLAQKSPQHHFYARNVIRYGIAQGYDLTQAQKLNAMLLDDTQRPKKQGRQKTVGLINERKQICFILRLLFLKTKRQTSKIKRLTYLSNPAKIMRPRCEFILPKSVIVKRGLYTTATSSPSINNAFDIVATATGLSFDMVKNAWKGEESKKWVAKKG